MPSPEDYREAAERCRRIGSVVARHLDVARRARELHPAVTGVPADGLHTELATLVVALHRASDAVGRLADRYEGLAARADELAHIVHPWWSR